MRKAEKIGLSIIIPVYNAEAYIVETLERITAALQGTSFDAEIIAIDDGSTDESAKRAREFKAPKGIVFKHLAQKNTGRYLARKAGVNLSTKENILFVDSRVYLDEGSLRFLASQLENDPDQLWNGHVNIDKKGNIFARFWDAIVLIAWRRYFRRPKTTSYGSDEFDYYPKGTGFFYVPKHRLLAAMEYFESQTNDLQYSSDDTLLIRFMIKRQNIHLSPEFSCLYHGRSTMKAFLKHAYNRGQFFVDGFLRPGNRFFVPLLLVLALSLAAVVALIIWPLQIGAVVLAGAGLFVVGLFMGSILLGLGAADAASLAVLGIPFTVVYLAGLWRGVVRKVLKDEKNR